MNNQQFRRLVLDTPARSNGTASTPSPASAASASLGSRKRSSMPMTPRNIKGSVTSEFARQIAERNTKGKPTKTFKTTAPKGSKLAAGYHDRTQDRVDEESDERTQRIKELEESLKEGEIDREMFDKMVEEIAGGDISATHLVRGLDRKLLERVRRGEDVLNGVASKTDENSPDFEDEFDELAEQEIAPVVKEKTEKKGEIAPPLMPVAGVKRNRDAILAELKASRKAAAEVAAAEHAKKYPALGPGFRKIGPQGETSRIETDSRGREILIITDAEGKEKRKVRKKKDEEKVPVVHQVLDDGKNIAKPPTPLPAVEEGDDDDLDIFEGVGSNFNPLAGLVADDDNSSEDEDTQKQPSENARVTSDPERKKIRSTFEPEGEVSAPSPSSTTADQDPPTSLPPSRRNYFDSAPTPTSTTIDPLKDATVLAALKKVRNMDPDSLLLQTEEEARLKKRAALLAAADRDMEDMDLGFGSSRFDDAEDGEDKRVKLSEWRGHGADDEGADGERGVSKKRKRGPKKRKGDKNSAADVLKVMERQKKGDTLG
ncbi:hypothetical protein GQ43DRAFT_163930 [Delitschia confertaspora ATCC 74209]|uniref:RED-like N-terminal domain-containing protein n=1 Tax=Delitschia confertaspora ATCC 74209 TaxID=1513339 RepID=A0A9P4MPL7_9PLEO|nr:hypothetical protein GQ43DRAFT_163930 [Delitschia confertaspora ATCC 74209]